MTVPLLVSPKLLLPMLILLRRQALLKRDARLTLEIIAHSVGILSGSAHKIYTPQLKLREVCAQYAPIACLNIKKATSMKMPFYFFLKSVKIVTNLEHQNYMYILTVDGTWIYKYKTQRCVNDCAKTKLGQNIVEEQKAQEYFL